MAKMSLKEKAILSGVAILVLYFATIAFWFLRSNSRMMAKKKLRNEELKVLREKREIGRQKELEEQYEDAVASIPVIEKGKSADTEWMRIIGDIANENNIKIDDIREVHDNTEVSSEMQCKIFEVAWTGAVESIVKFLYTLQNTKVGLFDVKTLNFSPIVKQQGFMKGKMTIICMFKTAED